MRTKDSDIRPALVSYLAEKRQDLGSLNCIEELGICGGESRVDFAVLDNTIHGFEIKSECDSLTRLSTQVSYYCRALQFVTAVVSEKHYEAVIEKVPDWWGILQVKAKSGSLQVVQHRDSKQNPTTDPYAVAQFLWRDEALDLLTIYGLDSGIRAKPRKCLWERLSECIELNELTTLVSSRLQNRDAWRMQSLACG